MSDEYVYSYYRVNVPEKTRGCRKGGTGFVSMRIGRPGKRHLDGPGPFEYSVSFAFCSPCDNFSRPEAHKLTAGRAVSGVQSIKIKSKRPLPMRVVAWRALALSVSGINPHIKIPSWLSETLLINVQPYSRGSK